MTHVKGAPERVLRMCGGIDAAPLARPGRGAGPARACACWRWPNGPRRPTASTPAALEGGLTFLGLVGLIDPPRPEAIAAVAECRAAGIRVKMITGDHAGTAAAIAAQIGLAEPAPRADRGRSRQAGRRATGARGGGRRCLRPHQPRTQAAPGDRACRRTACRSP